MNISNNPIPSGEINEFNLEILFNLCKTCKKCCKDVPTLILDYHTLSYLSNKDNIAQFSSILENIVIYEVKSADLDSAAKLWQLWFDKNLLKTISIPIPIEDEKYHFTAFPKTRGICPFLMQQGNFSGCVLKEHKPFACKMFPYVWFQDHLMIATVCPLSKDKSDFDNERKPTIQELEKIKSLVAGYETFNQNKKQEYSTLVNNLRNHFEWRIVKFRNS